MTQSGLCFECGCEVQVEKDECPACQTSLTAPTCPSCHQPVAPERERADALNTPSGNSGWGGRCQSCGREFRSVTGIRGGHPRTMSDVVDELKQSHFEDPTDPFYGRSEIEMQGCESIHMAFDSWDYQPTIQINVRRLQAGNCGPNGTQLELDTAVVLTVAECAEIMRKLNGPLKVLMEPLPSWRDST